MEKLKYYLEMQSRIEEYFDKLWPLNRSLSGDDNRKTLEILKELIPLKISEISAGTECFDWNVPPEWNVRSAWIKNGRGEKIIDFAQNNLHLLGYSIPFSGVLDFNTLRTHLYTLPEQPELIPYLTSYYKRRWGFCLSHEHYNSLDENDTYEVFIDSELNESGSMTMGEVLVKGNSDKEILFSTYICHPSMGNNELSGILVSTFLCESLSKIKNLKYTYRFVFHPETIGTICFLKKTGDHLKNNLQGGLVLTCIGDSGHFTYKKSRIGNSIIDKVCMLLLEQTEVYFNEIDFSPRGSDERQYCSPGFNLPVGSLMRTMYGMYAEYHTSGDDKSFISFKSMEESVNKLLQIINVLENNEYYLNTIPYCEPQLGKRGLYPTLGSQKKSETFVDAMMWILNYSDGNHDLLDISQKSKIPILNLIDVAKELLKNGIIK